MNLFSRHASARRHTLLGVCGTFGAPSATPGLIATHRPITHQALMVAVLLVLTGQPLHGKRTFVEVSGTCR